MKKRKRFHLILSVLLALLLAIAGCSSSSSPPPAAEPDPAAVEPETSVPDEETDGEPVTIKILYPWGEGAFEERYRGIESLLPNVKLELVDSRAELEPLQELNAQQIVPDIIFANWGSIRSTSSI
ncbi:hypothetical protein ACE3MS_19820 [Paenibacillus dendritiformis]|uniref:hypothetical protein n=1 Tax=Paenibacillus dendritiformis TaxID=130049 RepID=UPI00364A0796